jgi:thioester reductase-like protein
MEDRSDIVGHEDGILVTGAAGFMGLRLVENLLERGFRNVKCIVRPSSAINKLETIAARFHGAVP